MSEINTTKSRRTRHHLADYQERGIEMEQPHSNVFDRCIEEVGLELDRPTEVQFRPGTDVGTGHRRCIVKRPENMNIIPESIPIVDPKSGNTFYFKLTYFGQKRYCARCRVHHVGVCPEIKEFFEAKEARERMAKNNEIKTKIVADSTMRKADPVPWV